MSDNRAMDKAYFSLLKTMAEPRTVRHIVADLHNPKAEPFAVIRADTSVRSGDGVEGTVISLHWNHAEAEATCLRLDGEKLS